MSNRKISVVFCNPARRHRTQGSEADFFDGSDTGIYPHNGLLSLASMIAMFPQYLVTVCDAFYEDISFERMLQLIISKNPDVVCLTAYTHTLYDVYECILQVKIKCPHALVIVGGPHVGLFPAETAEWPGVDYVIEGEGEEALVQLFDAHFGGEGASSIPGVTYKTDQGIHRGGYVYVKNLQCLPRVNLDLYDSTRGYCAIGRERVCASLTTSRGCPFSCSFCYTAGTPYRMKTLSQVLEDVHQYYARGITEFMIWDELFSCDTTRVSEWCDALMDEGLSVSWSFRTRAHTLSFDVLKKAKRAGCHRVHVGVEVGSDESLEKIGKGLRLRDVYQLAAWCKSLGIVLVTNWICGFPFETIEDCRKTCACALDIDAEYAEFNRLIAYPGTAIYKEGVAKGVIDTTELYRHCRTPQMNFQFPSYHGALSREEVDAFIGEAYRRYYLRISYILRSIVRTRSWHELVRKMRGMCTVFFSGMRG